MKTAPIGLALAAACALPVLAAGRATPGAARGEAIEWKIDSVHSAANFSVRHLVVSTVRGKLGPITGSVWFDGADPATIRADAKIDINHLSTGDDSRDRDLRGPDFFAIAKYPFITFKSRRATPGTGGHFNLIGDLTIRDVTREVALDVEGPSPVLKTAREQRTAATATMTLNRFDYGLKWNQLVESTTAIVGPDVKITIDIEIVRPNGLTLGGQE